MGVEDHVLEIGSGVGRWIGSLAQTYPQTTCWGIDYSYQMLKRAREYWLEGKELYLDWRNKGSQEVLKIQGYELKNFNLGLAKAEQLPFADQSQNLVLNSFLINGFNYLPSFSR